MPRPRANSTDDKLLGDIEEKSETDQLLENLAKEKRNNNSQNTSYTSDIGYSGHPDSVTTLDNDRTGACVLIKDRGSSVSYGSTNQLRVDRGGDQTLPVGTTVMAPIATLDTMNDLNQLCTEV